MTTSSKNHKGPAASSTTTTTTTTVKIHNHDRSNIYRKKGRCSSTTGSVMSGRRFRSSTRSQAPGSSSATSVRTTTMKDYQVEKLPFSWKLWCSAKYEELTHSLFLAPCLAVLTAMLSSALLVTLDKHLMESGHDFSNVVETTVEGCRALLGTIAGATISFAGIAFSVSLLTIQLGASQLSPRVVHTLFKDQFNKNVMALVVGTFTYCLVVLRSVRHALEDEEFDVVPHISAGVALALGILSILAIIAFIDHSAHSMDVSTILENVTRDTIAAIRELWVEVSEAAHTVEVEIGQDGMMTSHEVLPAFFDKNDNHEDDSKEDDTASESGSENMAAYERNHHSYVVRFRRSGWVQEIDLPSIIPLVPPKGRIQLRTIEGRYAIPGAEVCIVYWPITAYSDSEDEQQNEYFPAWLQETEDEILNAIAIGKSRTMRLDPSYGLRELVDVTLRALSPGVNDPTTAQDGIFHAAAVVIEFLRRNPPPHQYITPNRGMLILGEQHDHDGIVRLAYDEVRRCAANAPTVCIYLMESLRLIRESLINAGLENRAPEIERQVRLIEEGCLMTPQVEDDYKFITRARQDRFSDEALVRQSASRRIPRKDDMNLDIHTIISHEGIEFTN